MTPEQAKEKTLILIEESHQSMLKNLNRVIDERMTDFEPFENNFNLPRIILQALLDEEKHQYPHIEKHKKNFNKIEKQIYLQL